MHLLLVEDNRSLCSWLAQALQKSGWTVDCVGDGEAALFTLQGQRFDAVVLDLGLPRLSGEEVLKRVRAQGNDVPILILTAEGSLAARIEGLNGGADDFLSKPFDDQTLIRRVSRLLRPSKPAGPAGPASRPPGARLQPAAGRHIPARRRSTDSSRRLPAAQRTIQRTIRNRGPRPKRQQEPATS